jgi:hypothetical protein
VLAPFPSEALPLNGAFAPNVGNVLPVFVLAGLIFVVFLIGGARRLLRRDRA